MLDGGHQYQWLTAYARNRMTGHSLDWANQPAFFKDYSALSNYALPQPELESLSADSIFALLQKENTALKTSDSISQPLQRKDIATLLLLTSALTAKSTFKNGEIWYRSNASAGALHPLEFYLAFPGADDLPAGLYHYDLRKPALKRLRRDPGLADFAAACRNTGAASAGSGLTSTISISAIFYRTAWKYRERAYRYMLLDCGHAVENMALALQFLGLDFTIVLDFDDADINESLYLDEQREVALALVRFTSLELSAIAHKESSGLPEQESELSLPNQKADHNIVYPALHEIQQSTSAPLEKKFGPAAFTAKIFPEVTNWQKIPTDIAPPQSALSYIESLSRRRSQRNFVENTGALTLDNLYQLLNLLSADSQTSGRLRPDVSFFASGIADFKDGLYLFDHEHRACALVDEQELRPALAAAALDQRWLRHAALQFIFFADLELVDQEYGPRSYRCLNIEAGRLGQRLYLGATALDLGCCAVGAFYDRELAEVCSLVDNFDPLYLVALGPVAGK